MCVLMCRSEESDDDGNDASETDSDTQEPPKLVPVTANTREQEVTRPCKDDKETVNTSEEEEEEEDSDRESRVLVEVDERPQERWDCESVLR